MDVEREETPVDPRGQGRNTQERSLLTVTDVCAGDGVKGSV